MNENSMFFQIKYMIYKTKNYGQRNSVNMCPTGNFNVRKI